MKILQISPEYPPYNIGGGGLVVQEVARNLSKRGHNVEVISGYYPTGSIFYKVLFDHDQGIKVSLLPLIPNPRTKIELRTRMPPNISSFLYVLKTILKSDFQAIHIHGYGHCFIDYCAFVCRIFSRPYVLTLHGFPYAPRVGGFLTRVLYRLHFLAVGRVIISMANCVTAVSSEVLEEAMALGVDREHLRIVPNGLDIREYYEIEGSSPVREKYGISSSDWLIVAIGSLHERKGFQYLIRSIPLIRNNDRIKVLLIGANGGYADELARIANILNLKDKVIFTGYLDQRSKLAVIAQADIFLIPSIAEPYGLVALEAMAMKKPIIATNTGGLREILQNGKTALMIEPKSSESIAVAIMQLLENDTLRENLSINARAELANHGWDEIVDKYLAIYMGLKKVENSAHACF